MTGGIEHYIFSKFVKKTEFEQPLHNEQMKIWRRHERICENLSQSHQNQIECNSFLYSQNNKIKRETIRI